MKIKSAAIIGLGAVGGFLPCVCESIRRGNFV